MNDHNTVAMTTEDLQRFIGANKIEATILPMTEPTPTVIDAARALCVEADRIIKSLVFVADDRPILVINNGLARVDRRKLAECMGLTPKKVKFSSPEQALAYSGYEVGSMPPFGHKQPLPTLVDSNITKMETIFAGGGGIDAMMRLTSRELLRITRAKVADISRQDFPEISQMVKS